MLQVKVGIRLASLRQPFKKALHTAARLGADAVEIDARNEVRPEEFSQTGVRQLRKLLDDLNLRVGAVSFATRRGYDVAEDLDARIDATKRAMKFAYDLGASVVINQVGRVPAELTGPRCTLLLESLTDLGAYGQKVGAWLTAETGSESGTDLLGLVRALPQGALGVSFNPGNLIVNGFSAHDAVRALGSHILHVHAKDGVRDLAKGRGLEVPLGRGAVDFPDLLSVLEENNYRGVLTLDRDNAQDPEFEIGQAVKFLRNL